MGSESKAQIITGIYLTQGFRSEQRKHPPGLYEDLLDKLGGEVEIIEQIAECAQLFTNFFLDPANFALDWPGVLHYELTEELGAWLFHNLDEPNVVFSTEYERLFNEWVKK